MSEAKEHFREDFERKPEELEREANDVRADMERTLDELMNQLTPGELINQVMGRFRSGESNAFTRNLMTQVQNNPLPAVLAGTGLAWLMAASKQAPASQESDRAGEAKGKMSSAADSARSKGEGAKQSAQEAKAQATSRAQHFKERMSGSRQQTAENARHRAQAAQQGYNDLLRDQPLLMGALAVAAGAAIGAMLPASATENQMAGQASGKAEELKTKAQQKTEATASSRETSAEGPSVEATPKPEPPPPGAL